jgi:hypothetical protein
MELNEHRIIKAETFVPTTHEPTNAKVRVRPVEGQGLSTDLRIECPRHVRKEYPVGTSFEMQVKMCQREDGAYFLYNHYSWYMEPLT